MFSGCVLHRSRFTRCSLKNSLPPGARSWSMESLVLAAEQWPDACVGALDLAQRRNHRAFRRCGGRPQHQSISTLSFELARRVFQVHTVTGASGRNLATTFVCCRRPASISMRSAARPMLHAHHAPSEINVIHAAHDNICYVAKRI